MEVKNLSISKKQKCSRSETGKFEKYEHHHFGYFEKGNVKIEFPARGLSAKY